MAQEQEEIIIIEEADAAGVEKVASLPTESRAAGPSILKNKKILIIAGGLLLLLSLSTGAFILLSGHPAEKNPSPANEPVAEYVKTEKEAVIVPSELEKMIQKANTLYANGNQADALKLFEKIALYSEAVSQYNLGVVQLKDGEYKGALANFKRSIASGENRCVSAINAAVCCLYLGQEKNFNTYIDMAAAYLPQESSSPQYSYYYSLINYYRGHYLEALSALNHPTDDEYQATKNKLKASIDSLFGNYEDAIDTLQSTFQEEDSFSVGLLYANVGNMTLAKKYLSDAIIQNDKPIQEQLALAYVNLKSGYQNNAATAIKTLTEKYPDQVYIPYPIKVFLKPTLFDPDAVQRFYRNSKALRQSNTYQTIFYFAPYKVFNAEQTVNYIRKGNANIYIDDSFAAKEYLQKSTHSSGVDYGIALAIQKALQFRLRDANKDLTKLLKSNPNHSVLQYNLALTYAQLGDFSNAYDHFIRAYHLDANNYLSGIFAMMSAELIDKPNPKLASILIDNLTKESDAEEFQLYRTLIYIVQNNFPSAEKWLSNTYKERPFYLALNVLIASELGLDDQALKASDRLVTLQPNDLLPNLMAIDTRYNDQKTKTFAASAINYLKKRTFQYDDLYFGPQITRDKTILMGMMTGQLTPMIERLEGKLKTTSDNTTDITGALAQAQFYNQNFEEAYTLYNQLIDTYKLRDEKTLFMGASASIGAEHYENAIALLELSKLTNPNFMESRYALGLLYLQAQNNPGAVTQFTKMGNNTGFLSRFFDFAVDTDKLASEPKKYHPL
jgi:Flp pilus assembly protein TadD